MNEIARDITHAAGLCPHGNSPGKIGDPCTGSPLSPEGGHESDESAELKSGFSSKGYLEAYYRPMDANKMVAAMQELRMDDRSVMDIREVQRGFPELNEQEIENLFILSFHEEVALELMRRHPEDGLRVLDVGGGPTIYQHIPFTL